MGYRMKGSPAKLGTIRGTRAHAAAVKKADEEIKWGPEKEDVRATTEGRVTTTTTDKSQKGISKGYKSKEGYDPKKGCEEWLRKPGNEGKTCADYEAASRKWIEEQQKQHQRGGSETKCSCPDPAGGPTITWEPVNGVCQEDPRCAKKKEDKKCSCTGKKPNGESFTLNYPCGDEYQKMQAELRCKESTTTTKENVCSCTTPAGKTITYPCGTAEPAECSRRGGCPDERKKQAECNARGGRWMWDPRTCICKKKKRRPIKIGLNFKKYKKTGCGPGLFRKGNWCIDEKGRLLG